MSRIFHNPWPHERHDIRDVLRWKWGLGPKSDSRYPDAQAAAAWQAIDPRMCDTIPAQGWRVFWLGHASFLLQGCGMNVLIDPVFSDYCAPFPIRFAGLKRRTPPPIALEELPPIDVILLTHTHYDHCDLPTLLHFSGDTQMIVAEGHADWLRKQGFTKVRELAWWANVPLGPGVAVTATPAQHFTARSLWDRNRGHWCGWCIEGGGTRLWHAGDSGYCEIFREIGERLGPFDFSMIPIGAYAPRWFLKAMHMNPPEAVKVFQETRSQRAMAMHWGTFALTDEPMGEPPLWLAEAVAAEGIAADSFVAGSIGQCWQVG